MEVIYNWQISILNMFRLLCAFILLSQAEGLKDHGSNRNASIVYLAELTSSPTCQRGAAVSMQYIAQVLAAQHVIERTEEVPGFNYELEVEDICQNRSLVAKVINEWLPRNVWDSRKDTSQSSSLPLGFIGPLTTRNALLAKSILQSTSIPIITPVAEASLLTHQQIRGNFFRSGPSAELEIKAMLNLARLNGWSYITCVFTDDEIGEEGAMIADELIKSMKICCAVSIKINTSNTDNEYYKSIIRDIRNEEEARVVVYYGSERSALLLMQAFELKNQLTSESIIIFPTPVRKFDADTANNRQFLKIISLSSLPNGGPLVEELKSSIQATLADKDSQPTWLRKLLLQCKSSCKESDINFDNLIHTVRATSALLSAFEMSVKDNATSSELDALTEPQVFYKNMQNNLLAQSLDKNFSFGSNGELELINGQPLLGVHLLRPSAAGGHLQINAVLSNGTLQHAASSRLDIDSRCTKKCLKCTKPNLDYIYIPGSSELVVVGTGTIRDIGPDYNYYSCSDKVTPAGMIRALAFDFGKKEFEKVAKMNVSTLYIDTCSTELHTYRLLHEIFGGTSAYLTDIYGKEHEVPLKNFILVLGDISSAISIALQSYIRLLNIPQICPGSTSSWLDDVERYPSFLRLTPSDIKQAKNILKICVKNKIKAIGLIFTSSTYGNSGAQLIQEYASEYGICIEKVFKIERVATSVERVALALTTDTNLPRAFVYFGDERVIPQLLSKMKELDNSGLWWKQGRMIIGSKTWGPSYSLIQGNEDMTYGSLTFALATNFSWNNGQRNEFKNYLSTLNEKNMEYNHHFVNHWQHHFRCYLPLTNGVPFNKPCPSGCSLTSTNSRCGAITPLHSEDVFAKLVVMGWLTLGYTVKNARDGDYLKVLFESSSTSRQTYVTKLKDTHIPYSLGDSTQALRVFDPDTNQGPANYDVYNIRMNSSNLAEYVRTNSFRNGEMEDSIHPVFYRSRKLDKNFGSECRLSSDCSSCPGNTRPKTNESTEPGANQVHIMLATIIALVATILALQIPTVLALVRIYLQKRKREYQLEEVQERPGIIPTSTRSSATETDISYDMIYVGKGSHDGGSLPAQQADLHPLPRERAATPDGLLNAEVHLNGLPDHSPDESGSYMTPSSDPFDRISSESTDPHAGIVCVHNGSPVHPEDSNFTLTLTPTSQRREFDNRAYIRNDGNSEATHEMSDLKNTPCS